MAVYYIQCEWWYCKSESGVWDRDLKKSNWKLSTNYITQSPYTWFGLGLKVLIRWAHYCTKKLKSRLIVIIDS